MLDKNTSHHVVRGRVHDVPHLAQSYKLHVSDAQEVGVNDAIRLTVDDADGDVTATYLTPEHAKLLARGLLEVAEAVEQRVHKLEVGEAVETVEQLKALPAGTTIFSGSGRPWYKIDSDKWEGSNGRTFDSSIAMVLAPITVGRLGDAN